MLWANRWAPGTIPYTTQSPIPAGGCTLFVEHGSCPMHPLKRSLGWSIMIACLVPAILTTIFIVAEGFSLDGLYFILGMTTMSGLAVACLMLHIAWMFRTLTLWPVVFEAHDDGVRVTLAHRRYWCMLNSISPSLATGEFVWIGGQQRKLIPSKKLPDTLKNKAHACWLELKHKDRKRWILLSLHDVSDDASSSIMDWAQKLELNGEDVFTTSEPPSQVFYNYLDKKLW